MVQNWEIGEASFVLAKAISQRTKWLEESDYDPQRLVLELTDVCDLLYACIDPDELEKL